VSTACGRYTAAGTGDTMHRGLGQAPIRRYPRMSAEYTVSYRLRPPGGDEGAPEFAKTRSLGLGGLMFERGQALERGQSLLLEVALGECTVKAVGLVVYADRRLEGRWHIGVQFTEISESDRDALLGAYLQREYRIPPI